MIKMGAKVNEERERYMLPSCCAAARVHLEVLELLVEEGCDLGLGNRAGATPAHCAARSNQLPTLHFLDSKGAPMHAIDNRRNTPGDLANREGHSECVIFLLNLFRLRLRLRLHVLTGLRTAVFSPVLLPPVQHDSHHVQRAEMQGDGAPGQPAVALFEHTGGRFSDMAGMFSQLPRPDSKLLRRHAEVGRLLRRHGSVHRANVPLALREKSQPDRCRCMG